MAQDTMRLPIKLAGIGSAALLIGAFGFQYIGGMAPCELCIWQRWPHGTAILIAFIALLFIRYKRIRSFLCIIGAICAFSSAAVGVFHVGVEHGWWEGLASCSGGTLITTLDMNDLLNPNIDIAAPVACDQVPWSFAGISMAGWNAILSALLGFLWLFAAKRK